MALSKPAAELNEKELGEELGRVGTRMREISKRYSGKDAPDWTAEDSAEFDTLGEDWSALKERDDELATKRNAIAERERRSKIAGEVDERLKRTNAQPGRDDFSGDHDPDAPSQRDHYDALAAWVRSGSEYAPTERQRAAATRCGLSLNSREYVFRLADTEIIESRDIGGVAGANFKDLRQKFNRRNLSIGTDADGGYLLPTDLVMSLEEQLIAIGGPRQLASVIRTANGNPLKWPGADDTGNTGELLGEASDIGDSVDPTFSIKEWGSYKYSSKVIKVSYELLEDSPFNLAAYIFKALGERIGKIQATHFTTGDNSSKPQGMMTGISAGVTAAATNAITYDELVDLVTSVEEYYLNSGDRVSFMMHKNVAAKIRKLKDSTGQPLWQPNIQIGMPDLLLGYPIKLNRYMASSLSAGGKSIFFGDGSKYGIRDVGNVRMKRLDERYADTDEVAFICFMRSDGRWINTSAAKYLVQAAS